MSVPSILGLLVVEEEGGVFFMLGCEWSTCRCRYSLSQEPLSLHSEVSLVNSHLGKHFGWSAMHSQLAGS